MRTLTIAGRFCGPPTSANGGYFAGMLAALASRTVTVRLLKPPPLDRALTVEEDPDGALRVLDEMQLVGEARPAPVDLQPARRPRYLEAVEASRGYAASAITASRAASYAAPSGCAATA